MTRYLIFCGYFAILLAAKTSSADVTAVLQAPLEARTSLFSGELTRAKRADRSKVWHHPSPRKVMKAPEALPSQPLRRGQKQIILDDRAFYDASFTLRVLFMV